MFCSQCGIQIADGAKFCASCGAPQHGAASPIAQPKSNVMLKLAAAGGVVAILAAAAYALYTPGPAPAPTPVAAPAPASAAPVAAVEPPPPEPQAPEPAAPVNEPPPTASTPDPAEITAAHQALDQKIADEEAAAKKRTAKR